MGWFRKHLALWHGLMAICMAALLGFSLAKGNTFGVVYDAIFVVYGYGFATLYSTRWRD